MEYISAPFEVLAKGLHAGHPDLLVGPVPPATPGTLV